MAKKGTGLDGKQFQQFMELECPLCLRLFEQPKVLPCQHSFCLHCLQDYVAKRREASTIPCPLCKNTTVIPENDVTKFPNNFQLATLSDFMKDSAPFPNDDTPAGQDCEACTCGKVGLLETFCPTCKLWLCRACSDVHKSAPLTSAHCLSTSMEVSKLCAEVAFENEKELKRMQHICKQQLECLTEIKRTVLRGVNVAKEQIQSAAEEARQVINEKENALLHELSNFKEEFMRSQTAKFESVAKKNVRVDNMLRIVNEVKVSSCGREDKDKIEKVKDFLSKSETDPYLPASEENNLIPVYFVSSTDYLSDLKKWDMGYLHKDYEKTNSRQLIDRPVRLQEIASLDMGGLVTSLTYSKFNDSLLAVVEGSVIVIDPASGESKQFLSPLSKRKMVNPGNVACSEDGRHLFVIEKEDGERVITSYKHDGTFHSIITSQLALPIDLAVYQSHIFVCELENKCVYVLNMSGEIVMQLRKTPDHKALFTRPTHISVGGNGRFAVIDDSRRHVCIFDKHYTLLYTFFPHTTGPFLTDVQVLHDGSVVTGDGRRGLHYISPDFSKKGRVNSENISSLHPWSITFSETSCTIYIGSDTRKIYSLTVA